MRAAARTSAQIAPTVHAARRGLCVAMVAIAMAGMRSRVLRVPPTTTTTWATRAARVTATTTRGHARRNTRAAHITEPSATPVGVSGRFSLGGAMTVTAKVTAAMTVSTKYGRARMASRSPVRRLTFPR